MYKIEYDHNGFGIPGEYISPLSPMEMLEMDLPPEITICKAGRYTLLSHIDRGPFSPEGHEDKLCLPGVAIQRKSKTTGEYVYDIYVWCDECNRWHHHGLTEDEFMDPQPSHRMAHCTFRDNTIWQLAEVNMKIPSEPDFDREITEDERKETSKKRLRNYIDEGYYIAPVVFVSNINDVL